MGLLVALFFLHMLRSWRARRTPADWALPAPLPKDGKLGSYTLGPMLADGGTATVYNGTDEAGNRVAIKIPHRGPLRSKRFVRTFEREAQIGVDLRHPSIVRVFAAGVYRGGPGFARIPYFVMEFLEGQELDAILASGTLSESEAVNVARGVADALQWAHTRGVIHRDISPRNIFVTSKRSVKVMDFGISTVSERGGRKERGLAFGTPDYLAPERTREGSGADERSDLYSLGCLLYELLAGRPPFYANSAEITLQNHRRAPIPSLHAKGLASEGLDRIVQKLLAKEPVDRFQTAGELTSKLAELVPMT